MKNTKRLFVALSQCFFILISTIGCSSEKLETAADNINGAAQLANSVSESSQTEANAEISEAPVEEKAPGDITGSWCEESVENGDAGMAAYISDDCITIYHVSDNALIRTPFWICTYEKQQINIFTLNTTLNTERRADCVLLSSDDEKEIKYDNETIYFSSSIGDKELKRTELDFSEDYRILPKNAKQSAIETGGLSISIPNSFGFYSSNTNNNNGDTIQFISNDAVLTILSLQPEDIDLNKYSAKEYKTIIGTYTKTIVDGIKKQITAPSIEYDEDTTIFDSPGHKFKASGIYKDRLDGIHYVDTFGNQEANYIFTINLMAARNTNHDYESDFNELIDSIKTTTATTSINNSSNNGMKTMVGSSIDAATKKANELGVKELYDEDFGHGTRCKSLSDSTGGLSIDIIYSSTTKELLCASITTTNSTSSDKQKNFVKEMAAILCPTSDSNNVSNWAKKNVGSSKSTSINNFTYETSVGPSSNILYYAGYSEWEKWELDQ